MKVTYIKKMPSFLQVTFYGCDFIKNQLSLQLEANLFSKLF